VSGTGVAGTAVTLTNGAVFAGAGNYVCYGSDTAAGDTTLTVEFLYTSGASFTPEASTADAVKFVCIGN
jgi:hypothetical protein